MNSNNQERGGSSVEELPQEYRRQVVVLDRSQFWWNPMFPSGQFSICSMFAKQSWHGSLERPTRVG